MPSWRQVGRKLRENNNKSVGRREEMGFPIWPKEHNKEVCLTVPYFLWTNYWSSLQMERHAHFLCFKANLLLLQLPFTNIATKGHGFTPLGTQKDVRVCVCVCACVNQHLAPSRQNRTRLVAGCLDHIFWELLNISRRVRNLPCLPVPLNKKKEKKKTKEDMLKCCLRLTEGEKKSTLDKFTVNITFVSFVFQPTPESGRKYHSNVTLCVHFLLLTTKKL